MTTPEVVDWIPHRPPFLFVDDVVEVSPGRIVTTKRAEPEAAFFAGHYPGNPVMPGVLLCECAFQAGALLLARRLGPGGGTGVPVLTRINSARFKRLVRPGDGLTVEVTLDDELDGACFMTGRVSVGDRLALRVEFACTLAAGTEGDR